MIKYWNNWTYHLNQLSSKGVDLQRSYQIKLSHGVITKGIYYIRNSVYKGVMF